MLILLVFLYNNHRVVHRTLCLYRSLYCGKRNINEETMEVTFNKAGEFYISCYSMDNFELEVKIVAYLEEKKNGIYV